MFKNKNSHETKLYFVVIKSWMAQIVNSPEKMTAVADYSIFGSVKTNVTFKSSVCVSSIILFRGRLTASSSSRTCSGAAALSHALR